MEAKMIFRFSLLAGIVLFYLVHTIRYALEFRKNKFFTGRKKLFHSLMIWLFPFIWILFLKSFFKPIPGSYAFSKRADAGSFTDSGDGSWGFLASGDFDRIHDTTSDIGYDCGGGDAGGGDGGGE